MIVESIAALIDPLAAALYAWPISGSMRTSTWAYPLIEIVHIVGFVILVGSIFIVDLRLLGWGASGDRTVASAPLLQFVLPWTLASLLLVIPSGVLLFLAHAPDLAKNPALWLKLLLIGAAGANAAVFHRACRRRSASRCRERVTALVSLATWLSVIAAGRLIAYV